MFVLPLHSNTYTYTCMLQFALYEYTHTTTYTRTFILMSTLTNHTYTYTLTPTFALYTYIYPTVTLQLKNKTATNCVDRFLYMVTKLSKWREVSQNNLSVRILCWDNCVIP